MTDAIRQDETADARRTMLAPSAEPVPEHGPGIRRPDGSRSEAKHGSWPQGSDMPSHGRLLSRTYSLLATAGVVPLVVVIVALIVFQFDSQRQALLEQLEEDGGEHSILLNSVIRTAEDHVRRLRAWGEIYAQSGDPGAAPVGTGERLFVDGGVLLRGTGLAARPDAAAEQALAASLVRHMQLSHQGTPYLRWSYYLSAQGDLLGVVPLVEGQSFSGELRQASIDQALERFASLPAFAPGLDATGASAAPYWTDAYLDPAGAGWVVAYVAPIRAEGRLVGAVGTAVLLDFLTGFLRAFDDPAGRLWLVNDRSQILAASDGRIVAGIRLLDLKDVLPEGLQAVAPADLLAGSRAFHRFGDDWVLAQRVGSTPWTLLFVASSAELNGVIVPRLIPYGIILAALVVTLLLAHFLRQWLIVRPVLAFASYIRAEAADRQPAAPRLPTLWQPLARAVTSAFQAQRTSIAQIQDSEALKSAIIDSALDALVAMDEDGKIVEFNPSAEQIFGIERSTAIGQPLAELIIPARLRDRHHAGLRRHLETGEVRMLGRRVEMEAMRAGGEAFPVELAIAEVRQAGRRLFTAYLRDITGRRAMERALRESERHFKTIAESHPVPVNIARLDDRTILYASQAFADLVRLPLKDVIGVDNKRFYVDLGDRARLIAALEARGAIQGFEFAARRADGTVFPASLTSRVIEFQGVKAIISGVLDLTEQKGAEAEIARQREALRQSEQRFRTIAEAHPVPVLIVRRADRRVLYASQPFLELLRIGPDDVDRMGAELFTADDRKEIAGALRAKRAVENHEVTMRRADGSVFPAAITARPVEYEGEDAAVFGIVDLSEQKKAEAEIVRQREALHQSEKLNALGSLLANVAHELNNPLSVVVGYSTMMRDMAADERTRERATKVHAAAERCARIVKTFLTMARRKPEAWGPVQLNQIIEGALDVAGYGLRSAAVEVTLDLAPDLPPVSGDSDQLSLVLMNLIVNAQHALQPQPQPRRLEITSARHNGTVEVQVADNGPGIPAELAERIFDPFFTTKPQGVGTGIGLSVCQGIVAAHGGEIALAAPPEGGTRFTITMPATTIEAQPAPDATLPAPIAGRVLVVEDEAEIAHMMAEVLSRDHHQVALAGSGRAALEHLSSHPVDLILSDVRMPDLDGPGLHHELAAIAPDLARRMVFVTGDVLTPETATFLAETSLPVMEKPLDPYDLRLKVRGYLAALHRPEGRTTPPE